MIPESDIEDGQLWLLEVDNRVVIPVDTHVRFVVTGADVIHDFAVPSLGLKIDCTPGRTMSFASPLALLLLFNVYSMIKLLEQHRTRSVQYSITCLFVIGHINFVTISLVLLLIICLHYFKIIV